MAVNVLVVDRADRLRDGLRDRLLEATRVVPVRGRGGDATGNAAPSVRDLVTVVGAAIDEFDATATITGTPLGAPVVCGKRGTQHERLSPAIETTDRDDPSPSLEHSAIHHSTPTGSC